MKLSLTAVFDEDFRKQVQEVILDQARAVARSTIDLTVREEIRRVVDRLSENYTRYKADFGSSLQVAIKGLVAERWGDIANQIDLYVAQAVDRIVAQKLKDKTVFEAEKQDEYMRRVVRSELKKIWLAGEKL